MLRGGILVSVQYGTQVRIILLITVKGELPHVQKARACWLIPCCCAGNL